MSTPTMFTPVEPGTTFSSRIGGLAKARETGILIAILLVITVTTIKNPAFLFSSDGFRDLLLTPSILVVVAIGEAMVIITRNVDLSVGSILGLAAYLTGRLFIDFPGIPILAVFAIGIIFGALLGLINGALVAFAKVPSTAASTSHGPEATGSIPLTCRGLFSGWVRRRSWESRY